MKSPLRRILQFGTIPALGLVALAASTGVTHAQGPGSHPPIVYTTPATFASLEDGTSIHPGDSLKLDGSNFGTDGLLCLTWSQTVYDSAYNDQGQYCFSALDWQPTRIVAVLPADLDGATQQNAQFAVYSNQNGKSNPLEVTFYPTMVFAQVTNSGPSLPIVRIECGPHGIQNSCDSSGGRHENTADEQCNFFNPCFYPLAEGTDTYTFHLDHGWIFVSARANAVDSSVGSAGIDSEPDYGARSGDVVVHWTVDPDTRIAQYTLAMWALGPKGVPFA